MSHGDLWAGIELKLDHARFHFERMESGLDSFDRHVV
jgi:hypothetical protein